MAESNQMDDSKMKITIKTPKDKKDVTVSEDALVKDLKREVSAAFGAGEDQLCLIFAGKILKDEDALKSHNIKDGLTVHLVIKSANRTLEPPPQRVSQEQASSNVQATPFGLGALGGLAGVNDLGIGSANFMEVQQRMQQQLMNNPDMMRQLMESPIVSQLMSNPDVMRQMIMGNPQMRELMERNPEITHMLNNPELIRQTMELARNPTMLQELMRTQDRAMSNLESLPGGFNALQRMYRDIQEPMLNAATETLRANPFASLASGAPGAPPSDSAQRGVENVEPLPNPWGSGGTAPSSATTTTSSARPATTGAAGAGSPAFNSPGVQSLMQQMLQNPQLMHNMMQAPYVQNMMQMMSSNPEFAQMMFSANPMFADNPQLQQQMQQIMPQMMQQMQSPEVQSLMSNPRAMQALMQIQQGLSELQMAAPGLIPTLAVPGLSVPQRPAGATTAPTAAPSATPAAVVTTPAPSSNASSASGLPDGNSQQQMNNFMTQMFQLMGGAGAGAGGAPPVGQPEQTYAAQLDQLASMGFVDRQANLQALVQTFGDVNAAIDRLLQQRQQQQP